MVLLLPEGQSQNVQTPPKTRQDISAVPMFQEHPDVGSTAGRTEKEGLEYVTYNAIINLW